MHLKRLEIQGFKSFADKIEFQFNSGVTIVVGPNGSGKSNIADSLRWVMGEQSAKSLRGTRMEDIIFAGSTKRKPVGMAEVAITFDNSTGLFPLEYNEVTVTRRVFRSGESDYLINKTPCRLRDIHELFMDTGVGKEAYSIIGQGKVEEILSAKPEERRTLIEEAAGIMKYRNRKLEAMRKLADTEQSLLRISDIINELENQIEPLSEQAAKAEEYKKHRDELSSLEINLAVNQLSDHKTKLQDMQRLVGELQDKVTVAEGAINTWETKLEERRYLLGQKDLEINNCQQEIFEEVTKMERAESKINVSEERARTFREQSERLDREVEELTAKLAGLDTEFLVERERIIELRAILAKAKAELADFEQDFSRLLDELTSGEATLENQKGDVIDILNRMADLRNQMHGRGAEQDGLKRREQQLSTALAQLRDEEGQAGKAFAQTKGKVSEVKAELDQTYESRAQVEEEIRLAHDMLTAKQTESSNLSSQINNKVSRHKVLSDMQHEYEGYQKGVKEVMTAYDTNKLKGVCGIVAELIRVPKNYETAVEVALGGALQNIVTETDIAAKEAINYLKRLNLGRATFLPLNSIKTNSTGEAEKQALKQPGAVGLAVDLIQFDARFSPVLQYLLGRIVVVENIDAAVAIAQKTGYRARLVTLDGDTINPGGSLSGGSYQKRGSNLLGRNREIDELAQQIEELKKQSRQVSDQEAILHTKLVEQNQILAQYRQLAQDLQIKLTGLEKDSQRLAEEVNRLKQQGNIYTMEREEITSRTKEIDLQVNEITEAIKLLEEESQRLQSDITSGQSHLRDNLSRRNAMTEKLTTLKVQVAELIQEEQGLMQSLQRYDQTTEELATGIAHRCAEKGEISFKSEDLQQNLCKYRGELEAFAAHKTLLQERLDDFKLQRESMVVQLTEAEQQFKTTQRMLVECQHNLHSNEVKHAKIEIEVETGLQRLLDDYELTYEEALLMRTEIPNKRVVTQRIQELRLAINQLGTVNLGAIEEYARVEERFLFLSGQAADLNSAKEGLYGVINEMNEIMSVRFRDAYDAIKVKFSEIFTQLFGGGNAELLLTNEEDLLETGVDIVAQPPGKKPQHLSLLSGGEKALTAISLLFAILTVKPSPFCVLDEIEASLDEANVRRFADFVKEFAQHTQFIVVTHRKGTMEVADVLYGVTMDENGVSKLVSMKLGEKVS